LVKTFFQRCSTYCPMIAQFPPPLTLKVFDRLHFKQIPIAGVENIDAFIETNAVQVDKPVETNIPLASRQTVKNSRLLTKISYIIDD